MEGLSLFLVLALVLSLILLSASAVLLLILLRANTNLKMPFNPADLLPSNPLTPDQGDRYTPDYEEETVPLDQFTPNPKKKVKLVFKNDDEGHGIEEKEDESS